MVRSEPSWELGTTISDMFHEELDIFDKAQIFYDELKEDIDSDEDPSVSDPAYGKCLTEQQEQFYPSVSSHLPVADEAKSVVSNTEREIQCNSCHNVFEDDDKLRDLKFWYKQVEGGTSVEYRCPACRDCAKCKNSDHTDKISLREEIEQQAVEDSITFDRENKKIWVTLPMRGEERFFLSSNRDIALNIYKKMCQKAAKDPSIKDEIIAAVDKLFRTGQALYLADVETERLEQFIHKDVQHWLPWRMVYKAESITTACRQVFDASTNTRRRPDGTGGRSLNDLLCKGRINSMNLLRMMIRFEIGLFALTGDLQQFYCSCKLHASMMNFKRY